MYRLRAGNTRRRSWSFRSTPASSDHLQPKTLLLCCDSEFFVRPKALCAERTATAPSEPRCAKTMALQTDSQLLLVVVVVVVVVACRASRCRRCVAVARCAAALVVAVAATRTPQLPKVGTKVLAMERCILALLVDWSFPFMSSDRSYEVSKMRYTDIHT